MREWIAEVERRLRSARLDGAAERAIAEELAQHLQDRYEELVARGMPAEAARTQVLSELGEGDMFARGVRSAVRPRPEPLPIGRPTFDGWLHGFWSDLRFGVRMLGRAPIYTAVAVLVVALAIGANTAIFSVVNAVLLRPPPGVREPERLAAVFTSDFSGPRYGASSYPDVAAIRDAGDVFEDVAAYTPQSFTVVGDGWTARGTGDIVSANYFHVLGVQPAAGRFFTEEEGDVGLRSSVAVINHDLWRDHFNLSAEVIGSKILVKGEPLTIVGVAPAEFGGSTRGARMQLWVPLSVGSELVGHDVANRGNRGLMVIGRLRPGANVETAQQRLNVIASRLHAEFPEYWTDINNRSRVFTLVPESEARLPLSARGRILGFLGLLMAAVLVVLLIACTNVANLMLSRASARSSEMGIRVALGATRARIVRHLLAESVLLSALGGIAGVLLAVWLAGLINAVRPVNAPVSLDLRIDGRVLAFATTITLLTGILFGLVPALQASRAPAPLLKIDSRGGARTGLRRALIVVQVAASLVLLVAGGLFLRSLRAAQSLDTGYSADNNVILTSFDLAVESYTIEQSVTFYDELMQRVAALPGAASLTLVERVPLGLSWARRWIQVEGYRPAAGEDMEVPFNGVAPGYFSTMGVALHGRDFSAADRTGAPLVVIVSESFARRFWPTENALGKRIALDGADAPLAEVIGIAADAKYRSLADEPQPYMYYPYLQRPSPNMTLVVRTAGDPDLLASALRAQIETVAPDLPPPSTRTFRQHMATATLPQRIAAVLLSGLGILAVTIAAIGLYGIIAFGVTQRAREFGIRMALGAVPGTVRRLVIGDALRLAVMGILCGTPIAVAVALLIRSFLMVPPIDPVPFIGVPLLLGLCAFLASYAPARRATAQDPVSALRAE